MGVAWADFIGGYRPDEIQSLLAESLARWLPFSGNTDPSDTGFVCTILDAQSGGLLAPLFLIGDIKPENAAKYLFFSLEKALRLTIITGDLTSRKSASIHPDGMFLTEKHFGGAIRMAAGSYIISVSGLTWEGDEAVACDLAMQMHLLNNDGLLAIIEESGNTVTRQFVQSATR
ncbi:MAG: hypothetical protein HY340_00340 [Candidatus Kerfeldbacteria bacterium]|nr:hypothetical protein [Candidatus Kerfeldbacteria bacterium]